MILCLECANREDVDYRLWLRWERRNSKRKGGELTPRPREAWPGPSEGPCRA